MKIKYLLTIPLGYLILSLSRKFSLTVFRYNIPLPYDKAAEKKTEIEIQEEWIENKNIRINTEKNSVYLDEKEINLTEMEYKILVLLMKNPGKIFSVQNIYESIWEAPYLYSSGNTVMVHIRRLRKKIEKDPQNPKLIVSTWGKGYHFEKNK